MHCCSFTVTGSEPRLCRLEWHPQWLVPSARAILVMQICADRDGTPLEVVPGADRPLRPPLTPLLNLPLQMGYLTLKEFCQINSFKFFSLITSVKMPPLSHSATVNKS
ncbi:hypothetical protein B5X24_HaOG203688 [Helicoverpa armigera]|uniref:Uncharacterized protein n=1 Tax=Helicoverpa armigera TaxID=29058 RepID=A0A2W1BU25_HELAM|nr:hypothetical protein B5X24_HaOG203688 [Helicoverpa armigera]